MIININDIIYSAHIYDIRWVVIDGKCNYTVVDWISDINKVEDEILMFETSVGVSYPMDETIVIRNELDNKLSKLRLDYINYLVGILVGEFGIVINGDMLKFENGLVHSLNSPAIVRYGYPDQHEYFICGEKLTYNEWLKHPQMRLRKIKKIMNG